MEKLLKQTKPPFYFPSKPQSKCICLAVELNQRTLRQERPSHKTSHLKASTEIKKVKITPKYFQVILSTRYYMKIYNFWHLLNTKNKRNFFVDKQRSNHDPLIIFSFPLTLALRTGLVSLVVQVTLGQVRLGEPGFYHKQAAIPKQVE